MAPSEPHAREPEPGPTPAPAVRTVRVPAPGERIKLGGFWDGYVAMIQIGRHGVEVLISFRDCSKPVWYSYEGSSIEPVGDDPRMLTIEMPELPEGSH